MSLKENIDYVKQELSTEEKFLEGSFKVEQFYKTYKRYLISGIALIIIAVAVFSITNFLEEQKNMESSRAYSTLVENPEDSATATKLKESNPALFNLFQLQQAIKTGDTNTLQNLSQSNDPFIKNLAGYQLATYGQQDSQLEALAAETQMEIKDLAYLQEAYLLLKANRFSEAKSKLAMIAFDSPVKPLANMLEHYTVKGNQ